jgi:protein O-GlcNAc transferase
MSHPKLCLGEREGVQLDVHCTNCGTSGVATIDEALTQAVQRHQAGRLDEAANIYRQILAVDPNNHDAWRLLGLVAHQSRNDAAAVHCLESALKSFPDAPDTYSDLGNVHFSAGRFHEAINCYVRALSLRPNSDATLFNLANAYQCQGNLSAAVECYRQAINANPNFAEAYCNLGNALTDLRQLHEAAACFYRAIELRPDLAEAHNSLGTVLYSLDKPQDAAVSCQRAVELRPAYAEAHSNLAVALRSVGDLPAAIAHQRQAMQLQPGSPKAHSGLLFTLHFSPDYDASAIYDEARRWSNRHAEPLSRFIHPHGNDRSADRRLKVGYVSPDFRDHCLAHFMVPLFTSHNHEHFEIFLYSDVLWPDAITDRLRAYADVWREIRAMSDQQFADQVRADGIDILVDLTMHMERNRLLAFARRPSPIQVTWLAYPGTTGLSSIDYRLTDPHLDPPGLLDRFYSEASFRLPDTFWCYDPLTDKPAINPLPALTKGYITFGCLNNFCKVNNEVLKLWSRVLGKVVRSQLLLLAPEGSVRQNIVQAMAHEGIAPGRVQFVSRKPRLDYLSTYNSIDIALDTIPYNGHTTSLDAFWMGVPVVTRVGNTVVGRAGLSQLNNLGLPDLIAQTPDHLVAIAASLASDLDQLAQLRAALRARMQSSPLMDAPRFAQSIESAYRWMWTSWCTN